MARRILLVDDNRDVRDSLKQLLELEGHSVSIAGDGRSALEIAAKEAPEIVVLDIGLPDMDGYELARRLRRLDTDVKGSADRCDGIRPAGRPRTLRRGGDQFAVLVKPLDLNALAEIIGQLPLH